jgi:hypothetical protein
MKRSISILIFESRAKHDYFVQNDVNRLGRRESIIELAYFLKDKIVIFHDKLSISSYNQNRAIDLMKEKLFLINTINNKFKKNY